MDLANVLIILVVIFWANYALFYLLSKAVLRYVAGRKLNEQQRFAAYRLNKIGEL